MRIWIAAAVLVGLGACGGSDGDLLHRHCTVTTATSDEAITFSVCGSERAEADWKDQCAVHARGLDPWTLIDNPDAALCFCEDAPKPCNEPGTREIKHVCPSSKALCDGRCAEIQWDDEHCGSCGNACPDRFRCCDGTCVNADTDESNCGDCYRVCQADERCDNGQCYSCDFHPDLTACP